jgi:5-oxoprolinase (ATP-hydrolysing)
VTLDGAALNYGVVVNPHDFSVDQSATESLRGRKREERKKLGYRNEIGCIDRGGTVSQLRTSCEEETGLKPPRPQWELRPYGPHAGLAYVREWFEKMRMEGEEVFDRA